MRAAFAGIDVAFAKRKYLPVVVCEIRDSVVEPLPLRDSVNRPPRGHGNAAALDASIVVEFANETARYLHAIECEFNVAIQRVAIDAPSDPKAAGRQRRSCEVELDRRRISCITTPSSEEFGTISAKASAHLARGGPQSRLPGANQLWMLVGFELFRRLRREWECLEVFPQAIVATLGAARFHKRSKEGQLFQLSEAARYTGWPTSPQLGLLDRIAFGSRHDRLDAYLSAWVASLPEHQRRALGTRPSDVIWIPSLGSL